MPVRQITIAILGLIGAMALAAYAAVDHKGTFPGPSVIVAQADLSTAM